MGMKKRLIKIIIGACLYAVALLLNTNIDWLTPALFIVAYVVVGGDVVWKACRNIIRGKVFDENLLMSMQL